MPESRQVGHRQVGNGQVEHGQVGHRQAGCGQKLDMDNKFGGSLYARHFRMRAGMDDLDS